jgi:hypothetical protein
MVLEKSGLKARDGLNDYRDITPQKEKFKFQITSL